MGRRANDLIGHIFGRLEVVKRGEDYTCKSGKSIGWICKCKCGKEIWARGTALNAGKYQSCGCYRKECMTKHGMSQSTEKIIYNGMIQRCTNLNHDAYHNYGGRGIKVCNRWSNKKTGLINFIKDMGLRPSKYVTLDRINNNGNYSPNNCRWANNNEQATNRRGTLQVILEGKILSFKEFCVLKNINYIRHHKKYKSSNLDINEYIKKFNL